MNFYTATITVDGQTWPVEEFKTRQEAIDRVGDVMTELEPIRIAAVITPVPMSEKETT